MSIHETIKLFEPISAHGQDIHELNIKRPKVEHLMSMDGVAGEMNQTTKLIEVLCDIPRNSVLQLDIEDLTNVMESISPFLKRLEAIGVTSEET